VIAFWPDRHHARASPPVIDGRKARYFCINAAPKALHGLKYPPSVEEKVGMGFVARMRTSRSLAEATHMATTATSAITTLSLRQGSSECASVWTSCEVRQQSSEARPHDRGRRMHRVCESKSKGTLCVYEIKKDAAKCRLTTGDARERVERSETYHS
jgi:hypothetical protein